MNNEQKQRAIKLITYWRDRSITTMPEEHFVSGDCMTDLLQELIDAPEPEPVGYTNETELDYVRKYEALPVSGTFWPTSDEDACVALYTAPPANNQSEQHLEMVNAPAPSVPDEQLQAAFDRGLKAGNEQSVAQQIEIHKLHDSLAAPQPALSDERILEIAMSDDVSLIEDQGPGVRPRITVHNSIGGVYALARAIERELLGENE